jgi:hypothetical protein
MGARMKRSEAIQELCDILIEAGFGENGPWISTATLKQILEGIEQRIGMLPPEIKTIDTDHEEMYVEVISNSWEQE